MGTGCNGELVLRLGKDGGGLSDDEEVDAEEVDDEEVDDEQVAEGGEIKRSEAKVLDWRLV